MKWITAEFVATDMIKNRNITSFASRNGANEPSIHKSMGSVSDLIDTHIPISSLCSTTSPDPTSCLSVASDFSENAFDRLSGHIIDNKHFIHTHIVPLNCKAVKGIVYYSDNRLDPVIMAVCQRQMLRTNLPIVSVSLAPLDFGHNIVLSAERGPLTLLRQTLVGLEASDTDIVFFCEHDVLYHPSHFDFTPPRSDTFYYNTNVWKVRWPDGHAVWTDDLQQTSGLCAYRDLLIDFYCQRIAQVECEGFNRHYEPGSKQTVGSQLVENWQSSYPNLDIRHHNTLTRSKWSPDEFRNQRYAKGWKEASAVPGWGVTEGRFMEVINGLSAV